MSKEADQGQTYRFTWRGIGIEATFTPNLWGVTDHLEIRSIKPDGAPLPITATGYRSHYHQPGTIEEHGGDVVAQVVAWLDEEGAKPEWLNYDKATRQGELF